MIGSCLLRAGCFTMTTGELQARLKPEKGGQLDRQTDAWVHTLALLHAWLRMNYE